MRKRKAVPISEGMGKELDIWKRGYGFSHKWQVETALRYAYSFPEKVFHVTKNNFIKK